MSKKNKIVLIILIIVTICAVGGCVYSVMLNNNRDDNKEVEKTDAEKFLEEYSEYNGKVNESNNQEYINVSIDKDNTVKYVTEEDAVEILESKTGIIYFGFSTCPWCRSLVSSLTSVAKEMDETIYYLDILEIRSSFEVVDGVLHKTKDGTEGYYRLLELLDDELQDFYLTDEDKNKYNTEEKRLYAPTLVAVKDGKITSVHVGTVESQESGYDKLTDKQVTELEKIIKKLIESKNAEVCTDDKC